LGRPLIQIQMDKGIPKENLIRNSWYQGEGRFIGDIAYWNGEIFVGLGISFGIYTADISKYGEKGFSPYKLLER
jgi:hypothetical protein